MKLQNQVINFIICVSFYLVGGMFGIDFGLICFLYLFTCLLLYFVYLSYNLYLTVERTLRNLLSFKFIKHIYPEQVNMRLLDWDIWKVLQTTCAERLKDWELSGNRANVVTKLFTADMLIKRENDIDDPVFVLAGHHSNLKRSFIVVHLKEYLTSVKHSTHVNEFEQQSCSDGGDGDNHNERSNLRPKPFLNTQALSIVLNMQTTLASFHDKILVCCGFLDANCCAKLVEKNSKSIIALINKKQNIEMSKMSEIVEKTQIHLKYTIVSKTAYGGDEILHQFSSTLKQCYLFDDAVCQARRSLVASRSDNLHRRSQIKRRILSDDDDDEPLSVLSIGADMTTSVAATRPSNSVSTDNTTESLTDANKIYDMTAVKDINLDVDASESGGDKIKGVQQIIFYFPLEKPPVKLIV